MSKTWLTVLTALAMTAVSVTVFIARRAALGPESDGPLGWNVKLEVKGTLLTKDASISVIRPLDFRKQHISEERFEAGKELGEPSKWRRAGRRKHTWRRQANAANPEPFQLSYSFVCSWERPTAAMERTTIQMDAPPEDGRYLQATSQIQSTEKRMIEAAAQHAPESLASLDQVRALWEFVSALPDDPTATVHSALACLQSGTGSPLAKVRLLVALCRARGFPARMVQGVSLAGTGSPRQIQWAEAWVKNEWTPLDPNEGHFGVRDLPDYRLVFRTSDGPLVYARGARWDLTVTSVPRFAQTGEPFVVPTRKGFWRRLSLYSLQVSEQHLVEFLLLLPLAALLVSFARTIIGITTFGIFAPALIGLAFLDLRALPFALPIFVLTVLVGWGMRHWLERYHLLQVPRVSAMLTIVVLFLLVMIVTASNLGIVTTRYVTLFPLVILTFLVERFWTIEAEDSTLASFKALFGTLVVAVAVAVALGPTVVRTWMFRYPETLGVVLSGLFLLGRYTGYRLTELYRFEDLIKEQSRQETPRPHATSQEAKP